MLESRELDKTAGELHGNTDPVPDGIDSLNAESCQDTAESTKVWQ